MSPPHTSTIDNVFAALSHPVRREILASCAASPKTVADIAAPYAMSLNAISKHIKTLESAELISRRQDGNFHLISTSPAGLQPALDWLAHHTELWERSLLSLKSMLEDKA